MSGTLCKTGKKEAVEFYPMQMKPYHSHNPYTADVVHMLDIQ